MDLHPIQPKSNRAFSHDFAAAIFVFHNNEPAAMLVYQINPVGIAFFCYVNTFYCSINFAGHMKENALYTGHSFGKIRRYIVSLGTKNARLALIGLSLLRKIIA